jgi:hypothetical protein
LEEIIKELQPQKDYLTTDNTDTTDQKNYGGRQAYSSGLK